MGFHMLGLNLGLVLGVAASMSSLALIGFVVAGRQLARGVDPLRLAAWALLAAMLAHGEAVLNPRQMATIRAQAGFDVFKTANIPGLR